MVTMDTSTVPLLLKCHFNKLGVGEGCCAKFNPWYTGTGGSPGLFSMENSLYFKPTLCNIVQTSNSDNVGNVKLFVNIMSQ